MVQLNFLNAEVEDSGSGLYVNGKSLENLISAALGTIKRVPDRYDYLTKEDNGKPFASRLCNVSVTIDDRSADMSETISFSGDDGSVEEMKFAEYLERLAHEHTEEIEKGASEE